MATERRTRSRQAGRTQGRLMSAALDLLARKGYRGSTTREIARLAGVTEVTMYRHFRSKEELYVAAVREHGGRFLQIMPRPTQDAAADLTALAERFLRHLSSLPTQLIHILPDLNQNDAVSGAVSEIIRQFQDGVHALFRHHRASGAIAAEPDNLLYTAFVGPLYLRALAAGGAGDFDCRRFVERFLAGFCG